MVAKVNSNQVADDDRADDGESLSSSTLARRLQHAQPGSMILPNAIQACCPLRALFARSAPTATTSDRGLDRRIPLLLHDRWKLLQS